MCRRKHQRQCRSCPSLASTFVGISAIGAFDDDAFPKATHTHTGTQTDQCVRLTQLTMGTFHSSQQLSLLFIAVY